MGEREVLSLKCHCKLVVNILCYAFSESLWDVITKLCPGEADPNSHPVIIYMRREVSGMKALQGTTLRSLGLTGGRAMLR